MGNGQRHSRYPDEVGGREQATRVSIEIVRERAQTVRSDDAKKLSHQWEHLGA